MSAKHMSVDYSCFDSRVPTLPTKPVRGEDEDYRIRIDISIEGEPDHFSQRQFLSAISAFGIECGANVSIDRCDITTGEHESLDPDCLAVGGDEIMRKYVDGDNFVGVGKQAPTHDVEYDEDLPELVELDAPIQSYASVHGMKNQQGYTFSNGNYKPALYGPCPETAAREEFDGKYLNMLDKEFVKHGCYLDVNEQLLLAEKEYEEGAWDNSMDAYPALPASCWPGLRRKNANHVYSKRELQNQMDRIEFLVGELPLVNKPELFGNGIEEEEGLERGEVAPATGNEANKDLVERRCGPPHSSGAC